MYKVRRRGRKSDALTATYILTVDALPGRKWTYGYAEMQRELMVLAGISAPEARNALFDAYLGD